MLTSQLYDAHGNPVSATAQLGDLGELEGIFSALKSVGSAVGGAAKTVGKTVAQAGVTVGKTVAQAGEKGLDVIEDAARYGCKGVNNSSVQQGAALTAQYGKYVPKYGQAASVVAQGVQVAGGLCSLAYPPKKPEKPEKPEKPPKAAVRPAVTAPPPPPVEPPKPTYPAGSMTWFESGTGRFKVAIPLAGTLGAPPPPDELPGLRAGQRGRYYVNPYYQIATADAPYGAAYTRSVLGDGLAQEATTCQVTIDGKPTTGSLVVAPDGARFCVVTVGTAPVGIPLVSEDVGRGRTGTLPWYKTYKLWLVIGGVGLLGAGTLSLVLIRRQAKQAR